MILTLDPVTRVHFNFGNLATIQLDRVQVPIKVRLRRGNRFFHRAILKRHFGWEDVEAARRRPGNPVARQRILRAMAWTREFLGLPLWQTAEMRADPVERNQRVILSMD